MSTFAVVAARMGSERLPGKSMARLAGKSSFEHIVERLERCHNLAGLVLATSTNPEDQTLSDCAQRLGIPFYRGSQHDVLGRTLKAAISVGADVIVEVTGDCPLIDPSVVDRVVEAYQNEKPHYAANDLQPSYPIGQGIDVFATAVLAEVESITNDPADREHVSLYIYEHPEKYRLLNVLAPPEHTRPGFRLCIDTREDYQVVDAIYNALYQTKPNFGLTDVIAFLESRPDILAINSHVIQKTPWIE